MILNASALGILAAVLLAVLSELGFKGKRMVGALFITLLLGGALSGAADMFLSLFGLAESAGVGKVGAVALKVVGVGYLFGFISDISEELGERGIASAVSTAGKVEILLLVFPYFLEICRLGVELQ